MRPARVAPEGDAASGAREPTRGARIVVLGAGFGGLYAALQLERLLPRGRHETVVVNRTNFSLFTPMLHEVAASDLDVTHIVNPIRKLLKRSDLFVGEVEDVDLRRRTVRLSHADGAHCHELEYDHLVLALGSVTNYYGIPGLEAGALTMKSLADALALRNRLIRTLDEAAFECAGDRRAALSTVLVGGAGFAGVETVAAINDFLREVVRFYPRLHEGLLRIVLVDAGAVVLPELPGELGRYARDKLAARGVEIRLDTSVVALDEAGVHLSDGSVVAASTVVWTGGTAPNPVVGRLPCADERGRVPVDECLAVPGWPGVWAVGDCARVPDVASGGFQPPTAQHALRQGKHVAANIAAALGGGPPRPFRFVTIGQLAAIGRRTGVAQILGRRFSGFLAWWLWRTIYLAKLPRFERKVRVALDWSLDLLFSKDLVQIELPATKGAEVGTESAAGSDAARPATDAHGGVLPDEHDGVRPPAPVGASG